MKGFFDKARVWAGTLLWIFCGWWFLLPPPRPFVESWFSRTWYRWVLSWTTPLTQCTRVPLVLPLAAIAFVSVLALWITNWNRNRRAGPHRYWRGALWGLRSMFMIIPVLLAWFVVFWGAGYRRLPVEVRLRLDTEAISEHESAMLQGLLLEEVKHNLASMQHRDASQAVSSIASSMTRIVGAWDGRKIDLPSRVKTVPKGLLLFNGTSGMCSPFTLEALVDGGLPDASFVGSAAHELGHIAGFCLEDEASFAGYVAGLQSGDSFARYACALNAYMDLTSRLKDEDFKRSFGLLPEAAKLDVKKMDEAYRRYHIAWFSRISRQAYDRYLRAQGIKEGIRSYSHGIMLLAFAWRKGIVSTFQSPFSDGR